MLHPATAGGMSEPRKGLPYFWVTGIARALVGESTCLLQPWLKAHYQLEKQPSSVNLVTWKAEHTTMVSARAEALAKSGYAVKVEDQNWFRLTGTTAILAGKPDLIGSRDGTFLVDDCKTGEPRDSDIVQVAIYLLAIPLAWNRPGMLVSGALTYRNATVVVSTEQAEALKANVFGLVRRLASTVPPEALPSGRECGWCEVTKADCPARIDQDERPVTTLEF